MSNFWTDEVTLIWKVEGEHEIQHYFVPDREDANFQDYMAAEAIEYNVKDAAGGKFYTVVGHYESAPNQPEPRLLHREHLDGQTLLIYSVPVDLVPKFRQWLEYLGTDEWTETEGFDDDLTFSVIVADVKNEI